MSGVISAGTATLAGVVGDTVASGLVDAAVGSALGAGFSAITGGNVGQGALFGGLTGGAGSLFGSAIGGAGAGFGGITSSNLGLDSLGSIFDSAPAAASADGTLEAGGALGNAAGSSGVTASNLEGSGSILGGGTSGLSGAVPAVTQGQLAAATAANAGSSGGGLLSGASGILGKNPLASLGILASGASSLMTSQANQDALKQQQAQQQQFNQSQSNLVNNFTPLNRQLSVTPQSVGNLNNYGQAGYTGWNGTGGNQLFYNNVNPATFNTSSTTGMKSGGAVKKNYATGGATQIDPTQQYYQQMLQQSMSGLGMGGTQGGGGYMSGPQIMSPRPNPMRNEGPSLASILSAMAQSAPAQVANRPQEPLTTQLANQIYPRQVSPVESGAYARGGAVKHPKPKALQISKTTQLTLPTNAIAAQPPQQGPMQAPDMNSTSQGIEGLPQGLARGGLPKILNHQQRPMGMPMQPMPNRIPTNTSGMMGNRLNPNNPNLNLSPLRMMATGGHLSGSADGQADTVPAKLSEGEYILPSDVISSLGNGNNNAGAKVVDNMVKNIRVHKNVNPAGVKGAKGKLPPKAKPIVQYIKKRKVAK